MALFRAILNAQYILSDSPFAVSWCKPYLLARPISSASIIYRKYLVQRHAYYLLDNAVSEIMTCIVYMLAAVFDQEIDKRFYIFLFVATQGMGDMSRIERTSKNVRAKFFAILAKNDSPENLARHSLANIAKIAIKNSTNFFT